MALDIVKELDIDIDVLLDKAEETKELINKTTDSETKERLQKHYNIYLKALNISLGSNNIE